MNNEYVRISGANPFNTQGKLILHWDKLHQYLTNGDTDCPIFMEVGLTNKCNMACYWCITENGRDNLNGQHLDISSLKNFLNDFSSMGGKAITFAGQGEPTFYPNFEEAVLYAKKLNLQLGLMTNGVYKKRYNKLIGENFDWLRISLDTLDVEKYKLWKQVDGVKIIINNVQELIKYSASIGINCNVGPNITLEHVIKLVDWVNATSGISYLQFRPILPRYYKESENDYKNTRISEINEEIWKYLDDEVKNNSKINLSDDKRFDLKNGTAFSFRSCEGHYFEPILAATGEVKVCTYHPTDERLTFGNINDTTFRDIWHSDKRKKAIEFTRSMDYKNKCQMCCKLSEPNKLIDYLKHPEEIKDLNFL
jgi:GTP 3',8-cyclase